MPLEAEFESKCPACGDAIEPGDEIARDEAGDWVHERCAEDDPRDLTFNLRDEA